MLCYFNRAGNLRYISTLATTFCYACISYIHSFVHTYVCVLLCSCACSFPFHISRNLSVRHIITNSTSNKNNNNNSDTNNKHAEKWEARIALVEKTKRALL